MEEIELVGLRPAFQGDLMITVHPSLPSDVVASDDNVVAHSETGHHHTVHGGPVYRSASPMTSYVVVGGEPVDFVHHRPFDTHRTIRVKAKAGTVLRVRRQREHTPEGWRMVAD